MEHGRKQGVGIIVGHILIKSSRADLYPGSPRQDVRRFESSHSFCYVLQLTDIAWPSIILKPLYGLVAEIDLILLVFLRKIRSEFPEQQIDVILPLSQSRHLDLDRI